MAQLQRIAIRDLRGATLATLHEPVVITDRDHIAGYFVPISPELVERLAYQHLAAFQRGLQQANDAWQANPDGYQPSEFAASVPPVSDQAALPERIQVRELSAELLRQHADTPGHRWIAVYTRGQLLGFIMPIGRDVVERLALGHVGHLLSGLRQANAELESQILATS